MNELACMFVLFDACNVFQLSIHTLQHIDFLVNYVLLKDWPIS